MTQPNRKREDKLKFVATTVGPGKHEIRAVRHPDGSVSLWATVGSPDLSVVLDPADVRRLSDWLGGAQS